MVLQLVEIVQPKGSLVLVNGWLKSIKLSVWCWDKAEAFL